MGVGARRPRRGVVLVGREPSSEALASVARGLAPRLEFAELARTIGAEVFSYESRFKPPLGAIAARAPLLSSSVAAFLERGRIDAIYATGEDLALRIAPLLQLSGWRGRFVTVVHQCLTKRRKAFVKAAAARWQVIICVSQAQRQVLIEDVGLPPEKVRFAYNWIDTEFFRPAQTPSSRAPYAYACGLENRDYETLIEAAGGLPYDFRIAASGFWGQQEGLGASAPGNVTVVGRRLPHEELRRDYAESRFVVAPLRAVPYAAGVTSIVEAMASGKAVIATASPGVAEYVEDGVSGFVVPPGDPAALRAAIARLWESPALCEAMGRRNREWVLRHATIEGYTRQVADWMNIAPTNARPPVALA
jgi:glycosyltransferase involved in cell wall biosynthesis